MNKFKNIIESPYSKFLLTLITILVPLFIYFFPRYEYKDIKIGLTANIQIININNGVDRKDLTFYFKDKQIQNLTYLKIRFKNTGTQPLIRQDFIKDLQITLPERIEIIDYKENPQGIFNIEKISNNILSFNSNLLNPKETVDLDLLIDVKNEPILLSEIKVDGRILGINNLQIKDQQILSEEEEQAQQRNCLIIIFIVLPISVLPMSLLVYIEKKSIKKTLQFALFLWVVLSIFMTALFLLKGFFPQLLLIPPK